jgi:excisionase family DNA binding protein
MSKVKLEDVNARAKSYGHESYWTIDEAATRLRCSRDSIKGWMSSGKLKKTKAGRRTIIAESAIQAFLTDSAKGDQHEDR